MMQKLTYDLDLRAVWTRGKYIYNFILKSDWHPSHSSLQGCKLCNFALSFSNFLFLKNNLCFSTDEPPH